MKQSRAFPVLRISPKAELSVRNGHPWIYDTEILDVSGACENGGLVDVASKKGRYLGTGFLSETSKIRVRLISRNPNDRFDEAFYERRLSYAWEYRKAVMGDDVSCCRLIFGEADQFPGLTVDRFGDILVTQTLSRGIEMIKPMLFPLLYRVLTRDGQKIRGIYERNDVSLRAHEGLEENKGFFPIPGLLVPEKTATVITENGIEYAVDFENGQKTGFFLDQKYNRQAVARLATL